MTGSTFPVRKTLVFILLVVGMVIMTYIYSCYFLSTICNIQPETPPAWLEHSHGSASLTTMDTNSTTQQPRLTRSEHVSRVTVQNPHMWKLPSLEQYPISSVVEEDVFTVLVLTHSRTEMMLKNVKNYLSMSKVARVVVLWQNGAEPYPDVSYLASLTNSSQRLVFRNKSDRMIRLRFQPFPEIQTQGVFNVDDDISVDERDLYHVFETWKKLPYAMVGFTQRDYTGARMSGYKYLVNDSRQAYSMILTRDCFFHKRYLQMFVNTLPAPVAHIIDMLMNCEDIAFNFMVSNFCKCSSARLVRPSYKYVHHGQFSGLSMRKDHAAQRDYCVNQFQRYYPSLPQREIYTF